MALTEQQLDWLAEQAEWQLSPLGYWFKPDGFDTPFRHPSKSCDQLIADHDGWMTEHGIRYALSRRRDRRGIWIWTADMWGEGAANDLPNIDADTLEAALAEALYVARGGPQ